MDVELVKAELKINLSDKKINSARLQMKFCLSEGGVAMGEK